MIATGGKLYDQCRDCGKLVHLNKLIFGSLHICLTDDERARKRETELMLRGQIVQQQIMAANPDWFAKMNEAVMRDVVAEIKAAD